MASPVNNFRHGYIVKSSSRCFFKQAGSLDLGFHRKVLYLFSSPPRRRGSSERRHPKNREKLVISRNDVNRIHAPLIAPICPCFRALIPLFQRQNKGIRAQEDKPVGAIKGALAPLKLHYEKRPICTRLWYVVPQSPDSRLRGNDGMLLSGGSLRERGHH